ncbi:MAG: LamG-like jellyroll fold domain-containing protein [Pirellulales bacterium]
MPVLCAARRCLLLASLAFLAALPAMPLVGEEPAKPAARLVAHWPLEHDARDIVGTAHGEPQNVTFSEQGAAFNGRDGRILVPAEKAPNAGQDDFSLSVWVRSHAPLEATLGDILGKFDPAARRGINLHLAGSSPAYSAMSDSRHVHFGIDDGYLSEWQDHGKPWESNSLISNLVAYNGGLYCGIADANRPQDRAHVFRLDEGGKWIDCGRLGSDANHHSVMSMIVHNGKLVAGTGIWDWVQALGGLPGAPAPAPTRVYQYEGGTTWKDLGQVGNGSRVLCLASFQGELYAGLDSAGGGLLFKYDGQEWINCGAPDGKNFECLLPVGGTLYASTHGNIYEYLGGKKWQRMGTAPHDINQIHSMQVFGGEILLGTWPQGYVLRRKGRDDWEKIGRLGLPEGQNLCNEVMDLTVYNGKLYAGLIPHAEVYRYERDGDWKQLGSLAQRADWDERTTATWTRVTCLSAFRGRLYAGTGSCQGRALDAPVDPSLGRVQSIQAGQVVSHERDIGGDWTHIAAIRRGRDLELHINGRPTSVSTLRDGPLFDLTNTAPLWIGFGAQNFFHGQLADLRWYQGALDKAEIEKLAQERSN